jgi:branched-chain amino acid aminotransferase
VQNLVLNESAKQRGFDEALLLNERGEVSECTSANIFAIFGSEVFTPPLSTSGCLPGVTRQILLEEIKIPGLTISERVLTPADLQNSEQVFITSTTRDMLPVLEIDSKALQQNAPSLQHLLSAFLVHQRSYISAHARRKTALLA